MGILKRKTLDSAFERKWCRWCGSELVRGRKCFSQWTKIMACPGSCASNWGHYQCSKSEFEALVLPDRYCGYCSKLLVRRETESYQAWVKRRSCNKSCAAFGNHANDVKKTITEVVSLEQRSGVKRYEPGSAEFEAVAALYAR